MIDEELLRKKLQNLWLRKPPVTPSSFAEANKLIDEIIEASRGSELEEAEEE